MDELDQALFESLGLDGARDAASRIEAMGLRLQETRGTALSGSAERGMREMSAGLDSHSGALNRNAQALQANTTALLAIAGMLAGGGSDLRLGAGMLPGFGAGAGWSGNVATADRWTRSAQRADTASRSGGMDGLDAAGGSDGGDSDGSGLGGRSRRRRWDRPYSGGTYGSLGGLPGAPYMGEALAAYGIAQSSAAHGVTLGNLLGAWSAGSAFGGPIGGAIGVGVDLIGSLFHHRHRPAQPDMPSYPSVYGAPGDFDYWAYRYRASGSLPAPTTAWQQPGAPAPALQLHLYVDGIRRSVQEVITDSTGLAQAALANGYFDGRRPI